MKKKGSRVTSVIISNVILCAVVLCAIVGKLVWAIATQHRDEFGLMLIRPSSEVDNELGLDQDLLRVPADAVL